jgi:large subunit ribosomal protein L1
MTKLTKKRKVALSKFDKNTAYSLTDAAGLLKEVISTKFDSSIDLDIRLGVDPRKANQMVRGIVTLPHGTGKVIRVLVLCTPDKEEEARAAGADHVGLDEYVEKIKGGWTDVDVIITMPSVMAKVGSLGKILGPRGLMPNPKTGTVTDDTARAVKEVKAGRVEFKIDKAGNIHVPVGKVAFSAAQIEENARAVIDAVAKARPHTAKGAYVQSCTLSATMSPPVRVDLREFAA